MEYKDNQSQADRYVKVTSYQPSIVIDSDMSLRQQCASVWVPNSQADPQRKTLNMDIKL